MDIKLPEWQNEYESRITKSAYEKLILEAQPLLDRALTIYEAYLKNLDPVLYEIYDDRLKELYPKLKLMAMVCPEEMAKLASKLVQDAEASLQATFLLDLAGAIKG